MQKCVIVQKKIRQFCNSTCSQPFYYFFSYVSCNFVISHIFILLLPQVLPDGTYIKYYCNLALRMTKQHLIKVLAF